MSFSGCTGQSPENDVAEDPDAAICDTRRGTRQPVPYRLVPGHSTLAMTCLFQRSSVLEIPVAEVSKFCSAHLRNPLFVLFLAAIAFIPATVQAQPKTGTESAFVAADALPHWIWLSEKEVDDQTVYLRKSFTLPADATSLKVLGTCDDEFTLYVDGKSVLSHGNWSEVAAQDLSNTLRLKDKKERPCVLAVRAKNSAGPAGLILRVLVQRGSATTAVITDTSWKATDKAAEGWERPGFDDSKWSAAVSLGKLGDKPRDGVNAALFASKTVSRPPTATPVEQLKVAKDFKVELLYTVPKGDEGSWVNLCTDPRGRLIVSDQYGGLYRITPPKLGGAVADTKVEKIPADIGEAQGLLWAFDSLYVVVNKGGKYENGLYRVRDTNGDDMVDTVEPLRMLNGGGEHGPHAVLLTPNGKSLVVVIGNQTKMTDLAANKVPKLWGEDHLLPRMPDGRGFMRDVLGPGGCIYQVTPDGKEWTLLATGFRNEFDAAFNRWGDLFSYDADMEWDMNTPWYRPTRVCQVVSGAEFGWRNGAGKWPAYYPDSIPGVVNVGPGSPTGIAFGYGAKFPAKYQDALYICDWSYGKLYAVHMTPQGASYTGSLEEFVTGAPLPLTDVIISPHDKAMYFTIGGRRVQSGLYRVTYAGSENTKEVMAEVTQPTPESGIRRKLESFHGHADPKAVETAWPYLGHADRHIRYAARVALEFQDPASWREMALTETKPTAAINALLALVRVSGTDPFHRAKDAAPPDPKLLVEILGALDKIDFKSLDVTQQLALLRTYSVAFNRLGPADEAMRERALARFAPWFPAGPKEVNGDLLNLLVYLQSPTVAAPAIAALEQAPTQEEQIEYARALRMLKAGWTPDLRKKFFTWCLKAANYKGGASFSLFVANIKKDAVATLSDEEKVALKEILEAKPETVPVNVAPPRPFVKEWKLEELQPLVDAGLKGRNFDNGRKMFGAANCFACHRYDNEGGAFGPDLSGVSGRFSARDLLESVVEPSKVISDQYAAVSITTLQGKTVTGRIINLNGDTLIINTDMLNPDAMTNVERSQIDEQVVSKTSMMPQGLLNSLSRDEVLDLMAYLLSRGDRNHAAFK